MGSNVTEEQEAKVGGNKSNALVRRIISRRTMPATVMPGPDQVTPRRVRFEEGERGRVPNHVGGEKPALSVLSAHDLLYNSDLE